MMTAMGLWMRCSNRKRKSVYKGIGHIQRRLRTGTALFTRYGLWEFIWIRGNRVFGNQFVLKFMWIRRDWLLWQIGIWIRNSSISVSADRDVSESRWRLICLRHIIAVAVIPRIFLTDCRLKRMRPFGNIWISMMWFSWICSSSWSVQKGGR